MTYKSDNALVVKKLNSYFGGEISGLDVKEIGKSIKLDTVREALHKHQFLCFRNQSLTADELVIFTQKFGNLLPHVLQQFSLEENPNIYVLSNIVVNGRPLGNEREGFGWHTDLTYMLRPPSYTILYGLEVPKEGGDTLFASLYSSWDTLEESVKNKLRGIETIHSYSHLYSKRTGVEPLTESQKALTPNVLQPTVRIHPHTGREGMYLNIGDCTGINGLHGDESNKIMNLIEELYNYTINNFFYTHNWHVRDLLIWDNRGLLHTATDYDSNKHRRLIWRTSVLGEKPIHWVPTEE
jgi:taurine dioxygenase